MLKIANGIVNEEQVAAIIKAGANHTIILNSGRELVISEADAAQIMAQTPQGPEPEEKPSKSK
jgi:hypothetical protein